MISPHAHIDSSAIVGSDCEIGLDVVIGPGVVLENRVVVGSGSIVMGPCRIGADCRISSGCILDASADFGDGELRLGSGVSLLAGAIISAKVTVASGARILAGTVIERPVPPHAIVGGNPAQIVGYTLSVDVPNAELSKSAAPWVELVTQSRIPGVTLHNMRRILDLRGNLTVGEFDRSVPFQPKRYFMVFGVPNAEIRGEHAHRTCEQFLVCTTGSCHVVADNGKVREEFLLDDPAIGLYLPAMTWAIQYKYSPDAVLLVFSSEFYDSSEYIRDYDEFLALASSAGKTLES